MQMKHARALTVIMTVLPDRSVPIGRKASDRRRLFRAGGVAGKIFISVPPLATTRTGWDIFSPFQNTMSQKPHVAIATTIEAMPQPLLMIVVCFLPFQDVVQEVARTCETFHRIAQVRVWHVGR